jgi:hypothetical protein
MMVTKRVYDLIEMVNINTTMCDVEMIMNLIKGIYAKMLQLSNPLTFNQALNLQKLLNQRKKS